MFSLIKKYRDKRLKEKITLAYLSNPITSDSRDDIADISHINSLFLYITDTDRLRELIEREYSDEY